MSKSQRIRNILIGLLTIVMGVVMFIFPEAGIYVAILFLCITLLFLGVKYIWYYASMARYMVGGKSLLFIGIILFDLGLFTFTLNSIPGAYVMLYLVIVYAFSGVIDILRALEARSVEAASWKLNLSVGIINILIAVCAVISGIVLRSDEDITYIFSLGLIYSGIMRIISAFRRTAIVYIS